MPYLLFKSYGSLVWTSSGQTAQKRQALAPCRNPAHHQLPPVAVVLDVADDQCVDNLHACYMQAHESPVRSMQYAHNENWLLTGEDDGKLKYWKPNLECVKVVLKL